VADFGGQFDDGPGAESAVEMVVQRNLGQAADINVDVGGRVSRVIRLSHRHHLT
jgi:hypothetical protein